MAAIARPAECMSGNSERDLRPRGDNSYRGRCMLYAPPMTEFPRTLKKGFAHRQVYTSL